MSNAELLDAIKTVASTAMSGLVGPSVNTALLRRVEEFVKLINAARVPGPSRDCLEAGLWLLADDLDRSHRICQDVGTIYGSAWHATMHRREGDFWNSKYWWRRASGLKWTGIVEKCRTALPRPPATLAARLSRESSYDAAGFVDLVEAHHADRAREIVDALIAIQRIEWITLFEECWHAAVE
jgi:hypothetical protein